MTRAIAKTASQFMLNEMRQMGFIGEAQYTVLMQNIGGGEGFEFREKIANVWDIIKEMPSTYESKDKIMRLHYFMGGFDWYINEKDQGDDANCTQRQVFGYTKTAEYPDGELGYISLVEITKAGAELDLYFTPKSWAEINPKPLRTRSKEVIWYKTMFPRDGRKFLAKVAEHPNTVVMQFINGEFMSIDESESNLNGKELLEWTDIPQ